MTETVDVTRLLDQSVARSRAQSDLLESILSSMAQGFLAVDARGGVTATNLRFRQMHQLPAELCVPGRHFMELARYAAAHGHYGPGDVEELAQNRWRAASSAPDIYRSESSAPDGMIYEVIGRRMPHGGFVNTYTDVTEARRAEAALRESEARFRLLAEHSGDVVCLNGFDGTWRYVSPASERVLGRRAEEMIQTNAADSVHPDDRDALEEFHTAMQSGKNGGMVTCRYQRPDGSWLWIEGHARVLVNHNGTPPTGYVVAWRDATERKTAELNLQDALNRMEEMAMKDGLTGLANRGHMDNTAASQWQQCVRYRQPFSVMLLDVDCFKQFNDHHGHAAGDDCLRAIARQMSVVARHPRDLPARYGGEEFALLMPATDAGGALYLAERLHRLVEEMSIEHKTNLPGGIVTVSIGVATAMPDQQALKDKSFGDLLSAADVALYSAKKNGRNQVIIAA